MLQIPKLCVLITSKLQRREFGPCFATDGPYTPAVNRGAGSALRCGTGAVSRVAAGQDADDADSLPGEVQRPAAVDVDVADTANEPRQVPASGQAPRFRHAT